MQDSILKYHINHLNQSIKLNQSINILHLAPGLAGVDAMVRGEGAAEVGHPAHQAARHVHLSGHHRTCLKGTIIGRYIAASTDYFVLLSPAACSSVMAVNSSSCLDLQRIRN